jgi:peptidoglycan/LPS O-acetylase OafA/YrhL
MKERNRIEFLDGLRGVAIFLVILYHAFVRWPNVVPYGSVYADFPLAKNGWMGVELFFVISGFVIYMTLERCNTFGEFMYRRWLRLFPAMLVATAVIYLSVGYFKVRPAGIPRLRDLVPGLLFMEPSLFVKLFRMQFDSLEGSFWSLYVEVKFYVIFGAIYFKFGARSFKLSLVFSFLIGVLLDLFCHVVNVNALTFLAHQFNDVLSGKYFGWFLVGVVGYEFSKRRDKMKFIYVILSAAAIVVYTGISRNNAGVALFSSAVMMLFIGALCSTKIQSVLSLRILLLLGFISYPLYLIHENLLISMINAIGTRFRPMPDYFIPVIPMLVLIAFAYFVAAAVEPCLRGLIKKVSGLFWSKFLSAIKA